MQDHAHRSPQPAPSLPSPPCSRGVPSPARGGGGAAETWADARLAARLLAADPHGLGGAVVRAAPGPVREAWLDALRAALPPGTPWRRMPPGIGDDRLLGGLDLAATLAAGRPVIQPGLMVEADGGLIVVPMAERLPAGTAARLACALDTAAVDGRTARFGLVLLDEGGEDEAVAEALADRAAFRIDLSAVAAAEAGLGRFGRAPGTGAEDPPVHGGRPAPPLSAFGSGGATPGTRATEAVAGSLGQAAAAREREAASSPGKAGSLPPLDPVRDLCAAAEAFGATSPRGPILAMRAARALAADGFGEEAAVTAAARLVLAPRATRLPAAADETRGEPDETPPDAPRPQADEVPPPGGPAEPDADAATGDTAREVMLEAVRAAIPPRLLERLLAGGPRLSGGPAGRAGQPAAAARTGRPIGSLRGDPRRGRLDLLATLRAAAPWQALRRGPRGTLDRMHRIVVRRNDLRIKKLRRRTETTTVFCVDASGSAALERLAEAKGAVELLLAEAYVRRDRVAMVAFRGVRAELVLPPTRSLTRAKRGLSGLPGGGGTPLAAGIDAALDVALGVRRGGGRPVIVLLTDGRANVARSGEGGRARAGAEALAAARASRAAGLPALVIDTGARGEGARALAEAMGARYLPLPRADAGLLGAAARGMSMAAA